MSGQPSKYGLADGPFVRPQKPFRRRLKKLFYQLTGLLFPLRKKLRTPLPDAVLSPASNISPSRKARLKCGHCSQAPRLAEYHGLPSCRLADFHDQGQLVCPYGCLGFGDCALSCPQKAIRLKSGFPEIDQNLCNGCGECLRACPKNLMELTGPQIRAFIACSSLSSLKKNAEYCEWACLGCAKCRKACPAGAIGRNGASGAFCVNQEICLNYGPDCGRACAEVCPRNLFNHFPAP